MRHASERKKISVRDWCPGAGNDTGRTKRSLRDVSKPHRLNRSFFLATRPCRLCYAQHSFETSVNGRTAKKARVQQEVARRTPLSLSFRTSTTFENDAAGPSGRPLRSTTFAIFDEAQRAGT